jgi:hypothetical protein
MPIDNQRADANFTLCSVLQDRAHQGLMIGYRHGKRSQSNWFEDQFSRIRLFVDSGHSRRAFRAYASALCRAEKSFPSGPMA